MERVEWLYSSTNGEWKFQHIWPQHAQSTSQNITVLTKMECAISVNQLVDNLFIKQNNFSKQPFTIKLIEVSLAVMFVAKGFELISGRIMPLAWLTEIHDYHLGFPVSLFMLQWSQWIVLPAIAFILLIAMLLSGVDKKEL